MAKLTIEEAKAQLERLVARAVRELSREDLPEFAWAIGDADDTLLCEMVDRRPAAKPLPAASAASE